jgi:hypothetical protein
MYQYLTVYSGLTCDVQIIYVFVKNTKMIIVLYLVFIINNYLNLSNSRLIKLAISTWLLSFEKMVLWAVPGM